jgi:uncharacterized protein YdeI (BOF family)
MKALMIIAAIAGVVTTTSAFAQTPATASATQATQPATQVASIEGVATTGPGAWVPPYGQPVHEKTRAEVYHELVQAEQDGQLAYLNSTLYAH